MFRVRNPTSKFLGLGRGTDPHYAVIHKSFGCKGTKGRGIMGLNWNARTNTEWVRSTPPEKRFLLVNLYLRLGILHCSFGGLAGADVGFEKGRGHGQAKLQKF